MKDKGIGSDYKYRVNAQKIDAECLKWFLDEQKISIRQLADKTSVSESTIRRWMKREEMPAYLIEEICEALALESVCDMRENEELKCSEPVTTFRYRNAEPDEDSVKLHVRIGVEIIIPKELFMQIFRKAMDEDGGFADLDFDDDTAQLIMDKGKAAWDDHYIPSAWLVQDALNAGIIKPEGNTQDNDIFKEDVTTGGPLS